MILYLDTSSLIKLYVEEPGTEEVQQRLARADVVATSIIAYPETHAALSRRHREGLVSKTEMETVVEQFRDTWFRFLAVSTTTPVYLRAGILAMRYGLRGMDALHLASYVELLGQGDVVEFLSHDIKLMRAASKAKQKPRS